MEIQYYGANGIKITTKKSCIVVDPVSDIADISVDVKKATAVIVTAPSLAPKKTNGLFIVETPGEYEFEDYSLKGIAAQARTAPVGDTSATMFKLLSGGDSVLIVGHVDEKLSEDQLESIGVVDVVIVPVGNSGYTLDAVGAAAIVRAVEPKIVIPVHASDDGVKYEVPQQSYEAFEKELGALVAEDIPEKLKLKALPEQLTVQKLQKS